DRRSDRARGRAGRGARQAARRDRARRDPRGSARVSARTALDHIRAHAARAPAQPALVVAGGGATPQSVGYGELVARVDALAARLRAVGVRPAQRCGLVARQGAGFIELALAILAADACLVPIADDHAGAVLDEFAARASLHWIALERPGDAPFELVAREPG